MSLLAASNLYRSFKMGDRTIEVLRDISIEIPAGESVFLCGASGAGKSTLLYTLAGLERPERGEVRFENTSLYAISDSSLAAIRNARFGFIFQSYHLLPELTALENVLLPAMINGGHPEQKAMDALERVGLKDRMQHLPSELSGGEQQRVAIARALINDPQILFADEPTGNLDSKNGNAILDLLLGLVQEEKKTLIVVTHDPQLALRGNRRLEIHDGQIAK